MIFSVVVDERRSIGMMMLPLLRFFPAPINTTPLSFPRTAVDTRMAWLERDGDEGEGGVGVGTEMGLGGVRWVHAVSVRVGFDASQICFNFLDAAGY